MQLSATVRAWCVTVVIAVAAGGLGWPVLHWSPAVPAAGLLPLVALIVGFAATEACVTHLTVGRQAHSFAFSEIPFIVGLFYFSPTQLIAARLVGTAIALAAVRRQAIMKLGFNLAQYALGSVVAVAVWHAMAGTSSDPSRSAVAALCATLAMSALSGIALHVILTVVGATPEPRASLRAIATGLLTASANAALAVVAINVARVNWSLLWAVLLIAGFLALAQRSHVQLQKRHHSLERLNNTSRDLGRDLHADSIAVEMLSGAVRVLDGIRCGAQTRGARRSDADRSAI